MLFDLFKIWMWEAIQRSLHSLPTLKKIAHQQSFSKELKSKKFPTGIFGIILLNFRDKNGRSISIV